MRAAGVVVPEIQVRRLRQRLPDRPLGPPQLREPRPRAAAGRRRLHPGGRRPRSAAPAERGPGPRARRPGAVRPGLAPRGRLPAGARSRPGSARTSSRCWPPPTSRPRRGHARRRWSSRCAWRASTSFRPCRLARCRPRAARRAGGGRAAAPRRAGGRIGQDRRPRRAAAYGRALESDGLSRLAMELRPARRHRRGEIVPFFQPVVRLSTAPSPASRPWPAGAIRAAA